MCKPLYHYYYYCSTHAIVHCVVFSCGTTDLAPPVNGQMTVESTLFGSVASYSCDPGYYLVGDAMRTCLLGGWNGTNPVCGNKLYFVINHSIVNWWKIVRTMHDSDFYNN